MVRKMLLVAGLVLVLFSFVGCQTVQGLGEDVTHLGEAGAEVLEGL